MYAYLGAGAGHVVLEMRVTDHTAVGGAVYVLCLNGNIYLDG